jgi:CII-binding regulator of phage lambda lysogenization HflD
MKKLMAILAIAALGWYTLQKTEFGAGVKEMFRGIKSPFGCSKAAKDEPTRDKIQRARQEMADMDKEIDRLIRPMAEYTAAIAKLKKDISATETGLAEQKEILRVLAKDLEKGTTTLVYSGATFTAERIEAKLQKDFKAYQRLESQLKSKKTLLEAKQTSLRGVQEQMAKVMAKKQEFEVRLAQLEADEEILQIAKLGSKLQVDQTLTTRIEAALGDIAHRHEVDRAELELRTGKVVEDDVVVPTRPEAKSDPASILRYLESAAPVASK